jgi:predicted MFS family arabinose efflux permease
MVLLRCGEPDDTIPAVDSERPAMAPPLSDVNASLATQPALSLPSDRRLPVMLCLAIFLAVLNFLAATPFYPQMAQDLQTTVPLLGQVVTLLAVLSAGLGLLAGPLADGYGYRWPLVIGVLAIAMALLATGLAPNYPVLLAVSVLMGLGDALVYALPFAIAATRFQGEAQRRMMGWMMASMSLASVIGVPLLTVLGGVTSWRVALSFAGLVAVLIAWFVADTLPPDARRQATSLRLSSLLAAYAPLLRHPHSLRLFAVSALRGMCWIGLFTYLGAFLGTALSLNAASIGLIYALAGGAFALGSVVAGGRLGEISPRVAIAAASFISGVLMALMLQTKNLGLILILLPVIAVAAAIWGVGVVTLLATESAAGAATTMVLNGSLLNFGAAGGAVLGGILIALGGYGALGIGFPCAALLATVLAWWPARS